MADDENHPGLLKSILDASSDCIKVLDLEGNLLSMNENGQRVMEVDDFDAIRGCPWPSFWQDRGNADALAALASARQGVSARFEGAACTMAGTPKWWDVSVIPIVDAGGRPEKLLSVSRDITAKRRDAATLHDLQGLNTLILASSRDCIVVLDLDGRTQFVSPGGIAAMEMESVSSVIGLSWLRVWTGQDHLAASEALAQARAGGVGRFLGFCPTHKGTPKWWDVVVSPVPGPDGAPERLVAIGRDFTAQKQAVDAVRDAEARMRLAQDAGGIGTFETFVDTDEFVASGRFFQLFGLEPSARAPTTAVTDLVLPEDRGQLSTAESRRAGIPLKPAEYRIRRVDTGQVRWIDRQAEFVTGEAGRPPRLVGIARDVTDRKNAELRQAALVELGDLLRHRRDTAEMSLAAAAILGRTLNLARAGYGRVDTLQRTVDVEQDWCADPAMGSVTGLHEFDEYGTYLPELIRGQTVDSSDVARDRRMQPGVDRFRRLGIRAMLNVPVLRHGSLVATLFAHDTAARAWTGEEIDFARTVADRVWAAMEQARAEGDLRRMNESLEALVTERTRERDRAWKNSRDLQLVLDTFGEIRAVNEAWTTILGWQRSEILGRRFFDLIHSDDRPTSEAALAARAAAEPPVFENRVCHKDGSWRSISWAAAPEDGLIYVSGRHVTEERAAAEALQLVQSRLRLMFDTTLQFLGFLDPRGIVLDANPASLAAIGCSLADVVGEPFWTTPWFTKTPGLAAKVEAGIEAVRRGEIFRYEGPVNMPDGPHSLDFSMRPVLDAAGRVVAIVPEATDTTERLLVDEALRQSQKMEAVGQLTGGLAHDFNNLLTGITGSLELMQTRVQQGRMGELDRYITAAQTAGKRAAALTHRLLAFSRRQTLDPRPTNVNQLVAGIEDLVRRTVGPAIETEVVGTVGLWHTLIDAGQLENALLNLCINARDAMPDGGRLTIETANKWLDERAAKDRELPPGQYLTLSVTDTGTGMAPDVAKRAFDPFFTTKPLGDGTGLGLSMVYGFARQSGGQVRIYSEPGQGTTICLYLPRLIGAEEPADLPAAHLEVPRAEPGETVLVVDDEPTVRMLVMEVLTDFGYNAVEAEDGATALRVLQSDTRLDLLVTDVGLPGGMNGRQVADAARASRPDLKVLFITGYAENAALGNGTLEPGMQVMTKPFAMDALACRVRDLIGQD